MNSFQNGLGVGMTGILLILGAIILFVILAGVYNVAADDRHTPITEWALDTSMTNSVESRASDLRTPEFTQAMIAAGASNYEASSRIAMAASAKGAQIGPSVCSRILPLLQEQLRIGRTNKCSGWSSMVSKHRECPPLEFHTTIGPSGILQRSLKRCWR